MRQSNNIFWCIKNDVFCGPMYHIYHSKAESLWTSQIQHLTFQIIQTMIISVFEIVPFYKRDFLLSIIKLHIIYVLINVIFSHLRESKITMSFYLKFCNTVYISYKWTDKSIPHNYKAVYNPFQSPLSIYCGLNNRNCFLCLISSGAGTTYPSGAPEFTPGV